MVRLMQNYKGRGEPYTVAASMKQGSNEFSPMVGVLVSVMRDNKNEEGWTWLLRQHHLHPSIEVLVMDHPITRVRYKYFTFISDRQKGLINCLSLPDVVNNMVHDQ